MSSESLITSYLSVTPASASNINPPSTSGLFVRIETVHLIIHQGTRVYRKLLAPDPQTSTRNKKFNQSFISRDEFIKTIRLIEGCTIQFEFDFRIVNNSYGGSGLNTITTEKNQPEINLLFHEILQENVKTTSFYVENMGRFAILTDI